MQEALLDTEYGLAACDELLLGWQVWRYKICKFQELGRMKLKIQEIQLKAAAYATSTTQVSSTFQSDTSTQSSASAA